MRLQDIMTTPVETLGPGSLVSEARTKLNLRRRHHLVITRGRTILGVVSSRDLAQADSDLQLEAIMSPSVVSASTRTTVREAANLMRGNAVGCLPVVDRGRVVGIITISDLLELLGRGVEKPTATSTRWTLPARGPRKGRPSSDRQRLTFVR